MAFTPTDLTIVRLVEAMTLLLGEHPQWDQIREALFDAASQSGHLRPPETGISIFLGAIREAHSKGGDS